MAIVIIYFVISVTMAILVISPEHFSSERAKFLYRLAKAKDSHLRNYLEVRSLVCFRI